MSEFVIHIRKPKTEEAHMVWCEAKTGASFVLVGLDHAASLQDSRLVPCSACVKIATDELRRLADGR